MIKESILSYKFVKTVKKHFQLVMLQKEINILIVIKFYFAKIIYLHLYKIKDLYLIE